MNSVIKPSTINILSGAQETISNDGPTSPAEPEAKQTKWGKFKYWVSEVCGTLRPVVKIFVSIVSAAAMFLNACGRYKANRNRVKECALAC